MLEKIMNLHLLLYAMTVLGWLGVLGMLATHLTYRRLIRKNTGMQTNLKEKWLNLWKTRDRLLSRMNRRYDTAEYPLKACAVDQIENPVAAEITWQLKEAEPPEGVTLKEDGVLTVSHDCTAQSIALTVSCSDGNKTLTADVTVLLETAKIGDVNYDNVIDEKDLEFAFLHYGKTEADGDWQSLRLADVDGDGKIDIADVAYLAYYAEEETDGTATEKGNEN